MTTVSLSATSLVALSGVALAATPLPSNLQALAIFWQIMLPSMTTADKLRFINNTMVPGPPIDVPRSELKIVLDGASESVINYATSGTNLQSRIACNYLLALVDYETFSPNIQTSDPTILALVQKISPDLLADPATGITSDIIARMMALITPLVPWWQMNGFTEPVNVQNLIEAGYLY